MTLNTNELFSSVTRGAFPRAEPANDGIMPKTFAIDAGATVIPLMAPVAVVTASGEWVFWDDAGAVAGSQIIRGFMWEDPSITTSATEEVLANVFMLGTVHLDDIVLIAGNTLANLKTALQTTVRERGIIVQGLELYR